MAMGNRLSSSVRWRVYAHGLPAAVWGGVLLALSVTSNLGPIEDVDIIAHQDKVLHFLEYFILAALAAFGLVRGTKRPREWQMRTAILFPAAYGVVLELLQLLVPERDFSTLDMLANVLGAVAGALMAMQVLEPVALRKR